MRKYSWLIRKNSNKLIQMYHKFIVVRDFFPLILRVLNLQKKWVKEEDETRKNTKSFGILMGFIESNIYLQN